MESKRAIIAIALSLVVILGWSYLADHMGWNGQPAPQTQQDQAAPQAAPQAAQQAAAPAPRSDAPVFLPSAGREVTVVTPLYKAVLHSGGGVLKHFSLTRYRTAITAGAPAVDLVDTAATVMSPLGLLVNGQPSWSTGQWSFDGGDLSLAAGQSGSLTFTGEVDGVRVVRELTFSADTYLISEKVRLAPLAEARTVRLGFTVGAGNLSPNGGQYDHTRVAWLQDGSFSEKTSASDLEKGVQETGALGWGAVMSNYFLVAAVPAEATGVTMKGKLQEGVYRVAMERGDVSIPSGGETSVACSYWIGPKDRELLKDAPNHLAEAINLGWFSIIARPLVDLLVFFNKYVGNYGVAIILLTVVIKLVFWPLSHKSYKSMEQMKKLQPMLQKLREKHGDDREKMNEEMMRLYKTYKVNPAGGCLPMLVQIPVFFGLYQALLNAIELRHASFVTHLPFTDMVWLADLSAKDPYYITPIVMGATMLLQQKLTPAPGDPTQAKIMMFMPVVFTFMFLSFPSGLVVYWLCNNVLSIAQQWWMLRKA